MKKEFKTFDNYIMEYPPEIQERLEEIILGIFENSDNRMLLLLPNLKNESE